jgi:E3 ubiquitin-protein ligase SHPRH
VDAYFTAYAAAIADRKEMLLEERTYLEAAEGRVTKKRTTRTAREAAADAIAIPIDDVKDLTDKLMRERQAFRDRRIEEDCTRPLKSLLIEIGNVVHGGYRHEEVVIAKTVASTIRRFVNKQSDYLEKLNKELDLFRATYNKRVTYYACLQEISDSVAPPDFQNLQHDIRKADEIINLLEGTIATNIVKGRYLSFLDNEKKTHDVHEDCPICFGTSEDEFAILLDCGHAFCVSCFKDFRKAHFMGSKCPRCKARIENKTYTKIRIRSGKTPEAEGSGEKEDNPGGAALETEGDAVEDVEEDPEETARLKRSADWKRLKLFDEERHRSIATLDVMGEYGSKVNFL